MSIEAYFERDGQQGGESQSIPSDIVGLFIDYNPSGRRAIAVVEINEAPGGANVYTFNDPDVVELIEEIGLPRHYFNSGSHTAQLLPGTSYDCPIHATKEISGRLVLQHIMEPNAGWAPAHMAS